MSRKRWGNKPDVEAVLERLKGFQKETVEYAFERLYTAADSTRRFLVADEVGLGKTLVARGVIAKAIEHMWDDIDRIDIVYICSNAQIATQNMRKLQLGGERFVHADRLTLLPQAIHDIRQNKVNYLAFSPGTSFDLRSSLGRKDERVLLYHLVQRLWPDPAAAPKNLFQGWVSHTDRWRRDLDEFLKNEQIDRALASAFKKRLYDVGRSPGWGGEGLRKKYLDLCDRFRRTRKHVPAGDRADQAALIGRLRSLLAETCVQALEPDLVILDEFQRFKNILDGDDEAAQLAKQLFTFSDAVADVRLLLLSATPYKMYTLHHERDEDDHYEDFLRTVEFLDPGMKETGRFRQQLDGYRQALYTVDRDVEPLTRAKNAIEADLRRIMSRTERIRAEEGATGMLREVPCEGVQLTAREVRSFLALQAIAREVGQPQVIEYWKSAPYLLNFMDEYKLKTTVVEGLSDGSRARIAELLSEADDALLDWEEIEAYSRLDPGNARLRHLIGWIERNELWRLLWLPPSLPYYKAPGPASAASKMCLTKKLAFSTWAVAPKAVASLLSYEVERRIFQKYDDTIRNTAEERKKRRPLLRFAFAKERYTGMPVLGMLYPSSALASIGDPRRHAGDRGSKLRLADLLLLVERELEPELEALATEHAHPEGDREDEAWYWAGPILFDLREAPETTRDWFAQGELPASWSGEGDDEEDSRWGEHVNEARKLISGEMRLGRPPEDLGEVLASLAVAGPAVCALRALTRASGAEGRAAVPARNSAARIGWAFRTLFNLPESMALIRGARRDEDVPYWRQVVDYCAACHLQAVLDEYVHTLRDLEGLFDKSDEEAHERLADTVSSALSLRTGTPRVDDIRPRGRSADVLKRRLRNHFAIRFGAQESEDGQAVAREGQVRVAFNSPFWPFFLVSTSVGQEGLDFHVYCHAVVHWNLPSNPVDLEQREGRVHRYKGHAVRKNVARALGGEALRGIEEDVWSALFDLASERSPNDHGLVPYWLYSFSDGARIERHVPALPLSRDAYQLEALRRSLAVYRMVFGQPRQDDLMAYLLDRLSAERLEELEPRLRIDLSPPPV